MPKYPPTYPDSELDPEHYRPYQWRDDYFEAAIARGSALCTEHRGRHVWVQTHTQTDDGFCQGLLYEQNARLLKKIMERRACREHPGSDGISPIACGTPTPGAIVTSTRSCP